MLAKPLMLSYVFHMCISSTRYTCVYVCEHLCTIFAFELWHFGAASVLEVFVVFFSFVLRLLLCFSNQLSD